MAQNSGKTGGRRRGPGRPFPKGVSGNPGGRPKKEFSLSAIAKAAIEADPKIAERIVKRWLDQVLAGKTEARRDLLDRLEGKVTQPVSGVVDGKIEIVVRYDGNRREREDKGDATE